MTRAAPIPCLHTVIRRAWLAVLMFAWLAWPAAARAHTPCSTNDVAGADVSRNIIQSPPPLAAPLDGVPLHGIRVLPATPGEATTNVCRDNVVGHFSTDLGCGVTPGNTES